VLMQIGRCYNKRIKSFFLNRRLYNWELSEHGSSFFDNIFYEYVIKCKLQ